MKTIVSTIVGAFLIGCTPTHNLVRIPYTAQEWTPCKVEIMRFNSLRTQQHKETIDASCATDVTRYYEEPGRD